MPSNYWNFDFDEVDEPMQVFYGIGRQKTNKKGVKKRKNGTAKSNRTCF